MKIKKKLKDLTLREFIDWKKENCKKCKNCIFRDIECNGYSNNCWINNKDIYSDKFLNQEIEIETDILSEKEKEYLKSIIRPFKDRVEYIEKSIGTLYFIAIAIKSIAIDCSIETIYLPYFEPKSKMYEGMELNKEYTLKELGL